MCAVARLRVGSLGLAAHDVAPHTVFGMLTSPLTAAVVGVAALLPILRRRAAVAAPSTAPTVEASITRRAQLVAEYLASPEEGHRVPYEVAAALFRLSSTGERWHHPYPWCMECAVR